MKKTNLKSSYSLAEAATRAERYSDAASLDKRAILEDLEQAVAQADTEQEHQAKTAIARAQCLLLALSRKLDVSADGLATMAYQFAEMGIQRLKLAREAQ